MSREIWDGPSVTSSFNSAKVKHMKQEVTKYGFIQKDTEQDRADSLDPEHYDINYKNPYLFGFGMLLFPFAFTQVIKLIGILSTLGYSFMIWESQFDYIKELIEFTGINIRVTLAFGIALLIWFTRTHIKRYKNTTLLNDKRQSGLISKS